VGDRFRFMTREVERVAKSAVQILQQQLQAEEVWLFGSQVREEGGPDSDLDFMVVVPASEEPRYRREQKAHSALRNLSLPKDVVVLTREEWDRESTCGTSLSSTVRREGLQLHGA